MSKYIKKYEFSQKPSDIKYLDDKPLDLTQEFKFFHNKNKFRKELTRLQHLFRNYTGNTLIASGIRDSYLKAENTEKYFLILFTTDERIKKADEIIEKNLELEFQNGCYYLESTTDYILLLTNNMKGLVSGVDAMEEIFTQSFEHYFKEKIIDDYVKIRPFKIFYCPEKS